MKAKNKYFTIKEYGIINQDDKSAQTDLGMSLEKNAFQEMENFILKNKESDSSELSDFITISYKRGTGKVFRVQNYVGLIQLRNGIIIEILPKIYFNDNKDDLKKSRELLLKMLRTLKNSPFKKYDNANLRSEKLPILEIFIKMFLEELSLLIKSGLKADYMKKEENLKFLKGKLKIKEQITQNTVHKERFFVQYDEYLHDIAENRLIKSTLQVLSAISTNIENQKNIRLYMGYFEEVKHSFNYEKDFAKCTATRLFANYEKIIRWCAVFLKGESFMHYKGSVISYALLFPMETLFESYVAHKIRGNYDEFKTQHQAYYLAKNGKSIFKIKPDIFAKESEIIFLIDTKWKEISNEQTNHYGISQPDLYQMLSYAKIYEHGEQKDVELMLVYPKTEKFKQPIGITFCDSKEVKLKVLPFDLENGCLISDSGC